MRCLCRFVYQVHFHAGKGAVYGVFAVGVKMELLQFVDRPVQVERTVAFFRFELDGMAVKFDLGFEVGIIEVIAFRAGSGRAAVRFTGDWKIPLHSA